MFVSHSDEEIIQYLGLHSEDEIILERRKFEQGYSTFYTTFKSFLVIAKETGEVMGKAGFHNWYLHHNRAEIGYALYDEKFMGKGYMSEANRLIVEFGFVVLSLHRIEAYTSTYNSASIKILQRLGFRKEGLLREHYNVNGIMEDSVCFGLLKHDFFVINAQNKNI